MPGKIDAPLNKKLQNVEWGEYKITELFEVRNTRCILARDVVLDSGNTPYLGAGAGNNATISYISYDENLLEEGPCIFIGGKTFVVTYQEHNFYSNDSHNLVLYVKNNKLKSKRIQLYICSCIYKSLKNKYSWSNSISYSKIQNDSVLLPTKNGEIDFDFMESFIAELETQRISALKAYLYITGLSNIDGGGGRLTEEEKHLLANFNNLKWGRFNLYKLFGKSTRGRRLKSADRIPGNLPFVTAGEAETGVSAYIGNSVEVFSKNTVTIDMFGSAKYRNYDYGCDDHIAVVHTENLSRYAAIFITSAVHKSSHNGQFNYGNNFYPKDADSLDIMLPVIHGQPDFNTMETIISAIHKLVIKDVVNYTDKKINATKNVVKNQ